MLALCRSQLKESDIHPFIGTVPFLCACVAPLPVRGLWEFLHILIIILIQFKYLFIYLFIPYKGAEHVRAKADLEKAKILARVEIKKVRME